MSCDQKIVTPFQRFIPLNMLFLMTVLDLWQAETPNEIKFSEE